MAITFRYKTLDGANETKKPVAKVTMKGRNGTPIEVLGLLDSGADVSVIPRGLADFLNLKMGQSSTSKGIGGQISVTDSHVDMQVRGSRSHELHNLGGVPVQVASDDSVPIIIGRSGFFNKFTITFDELNSKIRLKRNNERL